MSSSRPRLLVAALSVASVSTTTLREASLAADGPYMGAAINAGYVRGDSAYAALAAAQYSLVTAENACKWATISPSQGTYNFDDCDFVYATAKSSNQAFRGHNLAWGNYNPSWVDRLDPSAKREALIEYVGKVAARYPDAYAWDVYNEPVCDDFPFAAAAGLEICDGTTDGLNAIYKNSSWYPDVPDALELAFTTAAEALASVNATGVKLFLNDYMAESSTGVLYAAKADRVYTLAQQLLAKGIPLHGVGMQFHLDLTYSSFDGVAANMKRLGELGLEVHVTELDVSCSLTEATCSWSDTDAEKQASIYASLLQVCVEEPACTSFESWGVSDKYTWRGTSQHPLPFDENLNKKDAVDSMLKILGAEPGSDDGTAVVDDDDDGSGSECADLYAQCGGEGWTGPTECCSGGVCTASGEFYSQCQPVVAVEEGSSTAATFPFGVNLPPLRGCCNCHCGAAACTCFGYPIGCDCSD